MDKIANRLTELIGRTPLVALHTLSKTKGLSSLPAMYLLGKGDRKLLLKDTDLYEVMEFLRKN